MIIRRIIYLAVLLCGIAAILFQLAYKKSPPLQQYKTVPDFQLTERSGRIVSLADLKGRVWLANFFYASCQGPCPVINGRLGNLQAAALKNGDVRFVSFTTQPDTDTPEVLRRYAGRFHASDKWLFLTGDKEQLFDLANKGFLLTAVEQTGSRENPVIHSIKLALVDKAGNIRAYYDGSDETNTPRILHDIDRLLRE
jgi:protein SCO1/2